MKLHDSPISQTRMKKYLIMIPSVLLTVATLFAQDKQPISMSGYLTTMQSATFDSLSGPFLNENLIHNRLNLKGYLNDNITVAAEIRNRLFTGDLVRLGDYYTDLIGADNGFADMSWNIFEEQSFVFNTTLDRLWIDLQYEKFQITVGRQRINWGQAFVWNPNDIFNAYSFFDFDYIEKPGSDAVRLQYFTTSSSAAELAVKVDNNNDITAAGLYRFNKWGYDIQFLAGVVQGEDVVIGTGWSGALGSISFRGEASWFDNYEDFPGSESTVLITTGFDKVFNDNSTAQIQLIYCNNTLKPDSYTSFYSGNLSSKDMVFSEFSAFGQYTWAATPLLNIGLSAMWFPDLKGYFAGPSIDYSLAENIDFSLLWQHFNSIMAGTRTNINLGFLRLKYSF